jgi:FG-GAP repeat
MLLAAGAGAERAAADVRAVAKTVDLLFDAGAELDGGTGDALGTTTATGDVNNDGHSDVITSAGDSVKVLFGPIPSPVFDMTTLAGNGFEIDLAGNEQSPSVDAGDVNGDGFDDVLIGLPAAEAAGRTGAGAVIVVFGKANSTNVSIDAFGTSGFVIYGAGADDQTGASVAALDDVNGDGRADILVGAPNRANAAYVVFGKTSTTTVDLASLGSAGYRIEGVPFDVPSFIGGQLTGRSVASAGDVNGDDRDDLLIGASTSYSGKQYGGAAYLVYGKANTTTVELDALGNGGYAIEGAKDWDLAGVAVSGAGDVNGDGRPDAVVGAPGAGPRTNYSGIGYVVFGKTSRTTVELANLGSQGFKMLGTWGDQVGHAAAGGRDVNSDGLADVVLGAKEADHLREGSGSAYVVYGKASTKRVDLGDLPTKRGYRIDGPSWYARAGSAVATTRSVFGDAGADVLVGAPGVDPNGDTDAGALYAVDESPRQDSILEDVVLEGFTISAASRVLHAATSRATTIGYRLRRKAKVKLVVLRKVAGRSAGGPANQHCAKPSNAPAGRPKCVRLVKAGRLVREQGKGRRKLRVKAKLGDTKLKAGKYLLLLTARDGRGRVWGPVQIDIKVKQP